MTAKSVVDVILGEAKAGSYQDMLAIASLISNRATGAGTSWQDVVARTPEFNAYGNPLPRGVNKYRSMAQKAIDQVKTTGPVHNATFYATPSKVKNLPKGLSRVTQTDGHVFLTDPQKRPIYTASGLKRIDYAQINNSAHSNYPLNEASLMNLEYNSAGLPDANAPIPAGLFSATPHGNGLGLANLIDGNRNKSAVEYANQRKKRNQRLSPATEARINQAVAVVGKKHGIEIKPIVASGGQFSKNQLASGDFTGRRTGGPRHDHGGAGDIDFEVDGRLLSMAQPNDRQILTDIIEENVALGNVGVGYAPKYMGLSRVHIGGGNPASWGAKINGVRQPAPKFVQDAHARGMARYDPNQTLYVDVPTPQPRNASQTFAAPRGQVQREQLGPASNLNPLNNRPILNNGDGTYSTEETITVTHPLMNGGKPTNIPSIWGGQRYDNEDIIVDRALKSGKTFQSFESIPVAVAAAKERSNKLAHGLNGSVKRVALGPTLQAPKEAYQPKASDYTNYQMNVKQSVLPVGSAAPIPAATPAYTPKASDYANYMMNVKQPSSLADVPMQPEANIPIPAPTLEREQAKRNFGNNLKEQLKPETLAARGAGAMIGSLLGPLGTQIGAQLGPKVAQALNNKNQGGLFGLFGGSNQIPIPTNQYMGSSSSTWGSAQNQGATYTASDGATITGNGNGTYSRVNPKTGGVSVWNADGSRSDKGY